jgi:hypothetical protein
MSTFGICPEGVCKRRFEISEDFLNSMTPQTKINLYDKMVTHFINKKDYCFLIFSMKFLVDSLDDCMLSEKSGQLKDMILSLVSSMPIDTCKESIKNSLNNKERNISIFIKSE